MDEENDVLDWGAEDEESKNQDGNKNGARLTAGDNDDAEDAVSLGDEEEAQDYYMYQQEDQKEVPAAEVESSEVNVAPPFVGADEPSTATPSHLQREGSSISQVPSSNTGTPRRNSSTGRRSPQPALAPRITHALPPKPVVANVPFLPPSHPSIVEATAMSAPTRTTGRSESHKSKIHGASTSTVSTVGNGKGLTSGNELPPLPRGWEAREARSGSGGTYYYNVRTHESTWTRPVSNSSSSSPSRHFRGGSARRRRGSDSFLGTKSSSPRQSDYSHSQSQELSRHPKRAQPLDHDHATDMQIVPPPNATTMSYNDRHYRPGAGTDGANSGGNTNDRHHRNREDVDPRFNPRPDQAFAPSPEISPRARERARSLSPFPMSSQVASRGRDPRSIRPPRSSRGRNGNTDTDSSTHRDRDALLDSYPARDNWDQNLDYQESRRHSRHHYETSLDASLDDSRPPMPPRNRSTRGRRERDNQALREENRIPPDSRTRLPPSDKRDVRDDDEPRDHARHWPMQPSRGQEGDQVLNPAAPPQLSTHQPSQRKRDRPSRFGQQPTSPILQHGPLAARLPPVEPQTYPHRPMEEDDPFVPDDIRSPPPHELQQREVLEEKLSLIQASENGPSASASYRQPRQSKRIDQRDDMENMSSSEQHARRARLPLPPQAAEFHEVSSRPRDRTRRLSQDPLSLPRLNDQDAQPSMRSRDILGPAHGNFLSVSRSQPSEQGENYEDDEYDEVETAFRRQRLADMAHFPPDIQEVLRKGVEEDIKMRRIFMAAEEKEMARYPGVDMGPPMDVRRNEDETVGPGNYPSSQGYAPRGPRAMHSSINQNEATSPTHQNFGVGASSRNRERSPPPHIGGRGRENNAWREERGVRMPERGGRRDRGRFIPPSAVSGPNSVPIGNHRKSLGNGNGGPTGLPTRMPSGPPGAGMAEMNPRPTRGGGSMRGGAPSHPPRELQYDRAYGNDSADRFRSGKFENDGPPSRRRDSSLPPFERQPLSVDTGVSQRDRFLTSPHDIHYEPASADPSRLARTWTPRGEAPPEVFMGNAGAGTSDRRATSPSISRTSPHLSPLVDTGRPLSRYVDSRDRPGSSRGRLPPSDGRYQADRFARQSDELRRGGGGLEGRLSDRLDEPASSRHGLPLNPDQSNYSANGNVPDIFDSNGLPRARGKGRRSLPGFQEVPYAQLSFAKEHDHQQKSSHYPSQSYGHRELDVSRDDVDMDASPHMHPKVGRDEHIGRRRRQDNRPDMTRRPGSLLERLEMPVDGNDAQEEPLFSRSLSDRVQVPSKRDRDEMRDRYGVDDTFGVDGTDSVSKKARRKTPRGRRLRMAQS